jgi:signal peptidase II
MRRRGPTVSPVNLRAIAWAIAAAVFLLDRATKIWIESRVTLWDSHSVIPGFFNIVHTKNRGAAFGMFSDGDSQLRTVLLIGVSVGVLLFISYVLLRPGRGGFAATRLTIFGLALVFGGALGNIYDRVLYGQVTDFLEFYYRDWRFAAFNVADSAITVGASFLILDMWKTRKHTDVPQTN